MHTKRYLKKYGQEGNIKIIQKIIKEIISGHAEQMDVAILGRVAVQIF